MQEVLPNCWACAARSKESRIESLLAIPLTEGNDQIGVLILTQNTARTWQASEILVIRTLSDQVLIALNNAGLRRLVKNLSVTDEKSGLLKRASYLDLLQAETRRGLQQGTAVTVLLMQFGRRSALIKEYGEPAVTAVMEQIGQAVCGEYPDERSGVPLRDDDRRTGTRRHGRKRSAAGDGEIASGCSRKCVSRARTRQSNSAQDWRRR